MLTRSTALGSVFKSLSLRALHTTRPALFLPTPELPPNPTSAEALGFAPQGDRKRLLPQDLKVDVPASANSNISALKDARKPGRERRQRASPNPNTDADFFSDASSDSSTPSRRPSARARRTKSVSPDLIAVAESALPPDVQRRQRRDRAPKDGKIRAERPKRVDPAREFRERMSVLPRRRLVVDVVDHSPEGMFGKQRLVGQTFIRNVGFGRPRHPIPLEASQFLTNLPDTPIPVLSTTPAKSHHQTIQIAEWSAALNATMQGDDKTALPEVVRNVIGVGRQ
ncbi:hypothetical protein I314_00881 [Cryptococcus bacillisporus CA1873]|uniref:Uncharacterized protein n=1 Tax=Cryptococcus bacillisporus CA1873 TaxID=1296111 RepID=A0ABR5BH28_CRYGA|nr:hypothetical protein I314_00881 [Cryptococcus bacillisporus CA1873]|eukprot:KIR68462.1 hypothetical protein I314_00881 [Cryptococcus gattii CA1873]